MKPQDKFEIWLQEISKLNLSNISDLQAIDSALKELNHITREAWEMNQ